MKRPFSPLVWLCAACALALGALTLLDPSGVYADYVAALGDGTPAIAAAFTAAQDGVYPWSAAWADDSVPRAPSYHPLTETVTDDEMRSSVGDNEPFPDPPSEVTPSVEIIHPAPFEDPALQDGDLSGTEQAPDAGFITVDRDWFDDALFIGDSHTEGLCDYGGLSNATYYYKRGLDIWSVMKKSFVNGKLTIPQALSQRRFGKIYILLGINEIGCGTTESYAAQYASVVSQLRELQPDALIYIQAIFHTTQKKSDTSNYNNTSINARNEAIATIADGEHVFFIDCNAVFDDENGALTAAYSGDGVHLKAPYYTMWRDYLFQFGRAGVTPVESAQSNASTPAPSAAPAAPAASTVPAAPANPVEPASPGVEPPVPDPTVPAESGDISAESEAQAEPEAAPESEPESQEAAPEESPESDSEPDAPESGENSEEKNDESQ